MNLAGLSRPMRAAGLGLVGIAVLATVMGTLSAITSDDPAGDTAVPTESPTTAPGAPTEPTGPGQGPDLDPPESAPGDDTTQPEQDAGEDTDGQGDADEGTADEGTQPGDDEVDAGESGPGEATRSGPLRVYNNSNVDGLAERAADDLRGAGWHVTAWANYSDGTIPETTVYFRRGTEEQARAQALGREFGLRVEPRFEGIRDSSPGVIMIVARDYEESMKDN